MLVTPSLEPPPPVPLDFTPSADMLIRATHMRMALWRGATLDRPFSSTCNKRVTRRRRVKSAVTSSAVAQTQSDASDDETNTSLMTDSEWNWMNEAFDYDAEAEGEGHAARLIQ